MTITKHFIVLPVIVPLLTAFLLPVLARFNASLARLVGAIAASTTLVIASMILAETLPGAPLMTAFGGFLPPIGIVFYADKIGSLLLLALALGMLLFWPDRRERDIRVHALYLLLLAGGSGLALSGDLFNIFVLLEITSIASVALAASGRNAAAQAAALRFLVLSSIGSSLALAGIGVIYAVAGTLNLADLAVRSADSLANPLGAAAFLMLLLGFGVTAGLVPVNGWVPEVCAVAPSNVSALLAGFVSKLAMLVILRLVVLVFPLPVTQTMLLALGVVTLVLGELAALRARTFGHVLGFSSIGQLGLVAIAFSIPGEAGIFAGLSLALHHALVKPALFAMGRSWGGALASLAGAAKAEPLAAALFVLLSLSLLGIPPLPGFWAKLLLLAGALNMPGSGYTLAAVLVLAASVIEAAYLFRIIGLLYGSPTGEAQRPLLFNELLPAAVLTALLLSANIYLPRLGPQLQAAAAEAADVKGYFMRVLTGENVPRGGQR